MFSTNDYIIYKKEVCKIKEIKTINDLKYYVLKPVDDDSLIITIPVSNNSLIRNLIDKKDIEKLIQEIPNIEIIKCDNKVVETEYKRLLNSGKLEDLIKIIKTAYLRNENRVLNHKKISEKDDSYFKKAEKLLYNEISIGLGLSFDDTKKYIKEQVEALIS